MPSSRTTTRRPARRAEPVPAPIGLPPRRSTVARDAALLSAAGLACVGAGEALSRPLILGVCAGLVCWAAAVAHVILGRRAAQRHALNDRLVEALSPQLGFRQPDRRLVKTSGWTRGWPGHPRKVALRYAPGIDDADPAWKGDLVAVTNRRLLENYRIAHHDRRRCRIRIEWDPIDPDAPSTPAVQARAERTVTELLGPTARVTEVEWSENGRELQALEVRHEAGAKLAAGAYRTRIERVVSTMLPGRWRARWELIEDRVRFEVRPPLPKSVPHPQPDLSVNALHYLPMAVGEDGEIISWHLRGTGPHLIVVGKTGQGKTVVINGIVMEASQRGWPVWICDPKRVEFMGMRGWPNVQIVATTVPDQVALIYRAWEEMERRYALIEAGEADEASFEPLIFVLDEYRDFVGATAEWYAGIKARGMPTKCPVFEKVSSLARKGRTARIHLVLGTQRPDAEFLGGEMRDNFATRISLGRLSPQGAVMMWEASYIGVAIPRGIPGRGTAVSDDDRPVEIQAYWTPDPRRLRPDDTHDLEILQRLHPGQSTHPQLQVQLDDEPSDPEAEPPSPWHAVLAAQLIEATDLHPDPLEGIAAAVVDEPLTPHQRLALGTRPTATPTAPPALVSPNPDSPTPSPVDPTGSTEAAARESDELDDVALLEEDYQPVDDVGVSTLEPGDLILVDQDTDLWAVVENVCEDLEDPDLLCIDWRADDDEAGTFTVPDDGTVTARKPIDDFDEAA